MERRFEFSIGEFYHVYNRGNNKSTIFFDDKDRARFQKLLYICNGSKPVVFKNVQGVPLDKIDVGEKLVDIGLYCLMPNHFHLLLREIKEGGISRFMEKMSTAYSMYFNKKYNRTGKLFEGRFQASHIQDDRHLKYLFCYIHLNPVKIINLNWRTAEIKSANETQKYLDQYTYSSFMDYKSVSRKEDIILNKSSFPEYFSEPREFEKFIDEWLTIQGMPLD
ncbi:MAG: transposase [Patescibacteria group bacterium]